MHRHSSQAGEKSELRLLGFGGGTKVIGFRADLQWLTEFFEPSLRSTPQGSTTETVQSDVDPERYRELRQMLERGRVRQYDCFTLDGHFESFSGCESPDGGLVIWLDNFSLVLSVDESRGVFRLVADSAEARLRVGLMRVLREIATVRALRSGALPLHGAACVSGARAIGFLGKKTSGKTTSLVHWLQTPSTRFLANDRFFVFPRNGSWLANGMPTIVNIRTGTLRHFEELQRRAGEQPYHLARTLAEVQHGSSRPTRTSDGVSLSQTQFLQIVDRSAESEAPVSMLLFPERDDQVDNVVYEPLTTDEGAELLSANLLSPGTRIKTSEVFDRGPERAVPVEAVRAMCRRLSACGFCFRYRQGYRTLSKPVYPPRHSIAA